MIVAAGLVAGVVAGCSSHKDEVLRVGAMPSIPASDAAVWVGVNDFLRQSDIDRVKNGCGKLPGFVDALPGPSVIAVTASSIGPAVLTPIENCLRRLPFVRSVQGP